MKKEVNHRKQEAVSFVGRKGTNYAQNSATKEEKAYFQGILYTKDGSAEKEEIFKLSAKVCYNV